MSSLILYILTSAAILGLWHRCVQRISIPAAVALVLLPMCLTGRALLTGRVYGPIDLPFMAEPLHALAPKFGITTYNPVLSDVYAQMIPWHHAVRDAWTHGIWPLWNRFILCGDVLASSFQPAPYDPFNLLSLLIPAPLALTYSATMTFFIAVFAMFVFARAIELSERAAILAAAAWMFSGMIATFVEWPLSRAWAYLPLVLAGVRAVVHRPSWKSALLLMIAFVLLILTGHPETLLHITAIGAACGIVELACVRKDVVRAIACATGAGVLAFLLTAFALLPFLEAAPQTHDYGIRNGIYKHTTWPSMPDVVKKRVESSLYPITKDPDVNNWRTGGVALALAFVALAWSARRRETWFFFAVAVICAWSGANALPVARILHALPLFDVALNERFAYAAAFAIALLAAIAVDAWPSSISLRVAGVAIVIVIAAILHAWMWEVVPLAAVAILIAIRVPARVAIPVVCALILVQRAAIDGRIYPTWPREAFYPDVPLLHAIPNNSPEPFRIAAIGYVLIPNGSAMYDLEDARGYEAMTFERLYETYPLWSTPQIASFNVVTDPARPFLKFLNVRYIVKEKSVEPNPDALPRAFVPREIRFEKSALPSMLQANDFRNTAWIEVPGQSSSVFDNARGTVTTRNAPNGLDLDVTMDGDGWVVVSETAWKGWRAYVDGRRIRWSYANHAFIGLFVPRGRHRVELRYLPDSFTRGRAISLVALIAVVVISGARKLRRSR